MTADPLEAQAAAAGVAVRWRDAFGVERRVAPPTLRAVLDALRAPRVVPPLVTAEAGRAEPIPIGAGPFRLRREDGGLQEGVLGTGPDGRTLAPVVAEPGYHRLETSAGETILAVAPPRCFGLVASGAWGLAVPVYGLRRAGDGGIGDYRALTQFVAAAAAAGAAAVAISPVHAQFSADPTKFSPYAPSSRVLLNAVHADPDDPATPLPPALAAELARLEPLALVDWPAAGRARLARLRAAFAAFSASPAPAQAAFAAFRAARGKTLERHARFEALHARFLRDDPAAGDWRRWPPEFRDPASPAVAAFARAEAQEVAFHAFLQFLADAGLAAAQAAARTGGMSIGVITDLAVGVDAAGSDAWSRPGEMLAGLGIGAPPDAFNRNGQSWGLAAFSPAGLAASGYAGFRAMLGAALRHAGGVRIDHALGLRRLWVIPEGAAATEGAYLAFPETDLRRLIALESVRHGAIVLGEDLGTVPPGFREELDQAGLLGLEVMLFERDGAGAFVPPARWRRAAAAMTTTHDLPTVAGWWGGRDIDWQDRLGLADPAATASLRAARAGERAALWQAFQASGAASGPAPGPEAGAVVADAACAHLGTAASALALLPIEDALALEEQPNLPGTTDGHPNWCRRLPGPAEALLDAAPVRRRLAALARGRSRP